MKNIEKKRKSEELRKIKYIKKSRKKLSQNKNLSNVQNRIPIITTPQLFISLFQKKYFP